MVADAFGHGPDDGDFRILFQGQNTSLIFQQHRTLHCCTLGQGMVGFIVAVGFSFQRLRCPEHQLQHTAGAVVNAALRQCAVLDRLKHLFFHVVAAAGHIQVAAGPEALWPIVHGAPVGDHQPGKTPFGPENVRQKGFVVRAMDPVQLGVGAHEGGGVAFLDGDLKGRQVQLPQGAVIQHAVGGKAG